MATDEIQFTIETIQNCFDIQKTDHVILFLGLTGSGKSYLIDLLTDCRPQKRAGASLHSMTKKIEATRLVGRDGKDIVLVDTPSFNNSDSSKTDMDILAMIAAWLKRMYENGIQLSGIIWLHDISLSMDSRNSTRSLKMFEGLCGSDGARRSMIVTTMWGRLGANPQVAEEREKQLQRMCSNLAKQGTAIVRLKKTGENEGWAVLERLINDDRGKVPFLMQKEMVGTRLRCEETSAGYALHTDRQKLMVEQRGVIKSLLNKKSNDPKWKTMNKILRKEYEKAAKECQKEFGVVEEPQITFRKWMKFSFLLWRRREAEATELILKARRDMNLDM